MTCAIASAALRARRSGGFALMIALVIVVESFVVGRDLDFVHPWFWDWRLTGQAARKEVKDCEILCIGDSLVKFGVPPRVLEARLGRRAYNLAIGVGMPPSSYFILRRALESGTRPSAIIIDFKPHLLTYDLTSCARHWPEFLTARECLELSIAAGDAHFLAATMVARSLPSVRARFEIRANIEAAWRGVSVSPRDAVTAVWRNWRVNRVRQIMPRNPDAASQAFTWTVHLFPSDWKCREINRIFIDKIFSLAEQNGVKVFWLLPPVSPATQETSEKIGLDARFESFVRVVRERHPNVIVVDGRHAGYGQDLHVDPIHLDRAGASALASDLAGIIDRFEKEPTPSQHAWIALPRFQASTVEPDSLEDLEQSRIVLRDRNRHIKK